MSDVIDMSDWVEEKYGPLHLETDLECWNSDDGSVSVKGVGVYPYENFIGLTVVNLHLSLTEEQAEEISSWLMVRLG